MSVLLNTSIGEIVIDLYTSSCPLSTANFLQLCNLKYYNYSLLGEIQPDFLVKVQELSEVGNRAAGNVVDEREKRLVVPEMAKLLKHDKKGVVSFITNWENGVPYVGSQFMITLASKSLEYFDGKHAIFGQVMEGLEKGFGAISLTLSALVGIESFHVTKLTLAKVLDNLNATLVDSAGRPYVDIRIISTVVLDDPFPRPAGFPERCYSPPPPDYVIKSLRLEQTEEEKNMTPEQVLQKQRQDEMEARALTLEMVGDLPFADVKPKENVLFVAKLNKITRGADLEIIFGRFGVIVSCDVVKDHLGESKGFAFIEFEKQEDCEEAYSKMDDVLIDDRRIKVDFSQSVSRLIPKAPRNDVDKGYGVGLVKKSKYRASGNGDDEFGLVFEKKAAPSHSGVERLYGSRSGAEESSSRRDGGREDRSSNRDGTRGRYGERGDRDTERAKDRRRESPPRDRKSSSRKSMDRDGGRSRSRSRDRKDDRHSTYRRSTRDDERRSPRDRRSR